MPGRDCLPSGDPCPVQGSRPGTGPQWERRRNDTAASRRKDAADRSLDEPVDAAYPHKLIAVDRALEEAVVLALPSVRRADEGCVSRHD